MQLILHKQTDIIISIYQTVRVKKGGKIVNHLIEKIIDTLEYDPYEEIMAILDKKYPNYNQDEKIKRRAISALQRLGWSWGDIRNAINTEI